MKSLRESWSMRDGSPDVVMDHAAACHGRGYKRSRSTASQGRSVSSLASTPRAGPKTTRRATPRRRGGPPRTRCACPKRRDARPLRSRVAVTSPGGPLRPRCWRYASGLSPQASPLAVNAGRVPALAAHHDPEVPADGPDRAAHRHRDGSQAAAHSEGEARSADAEQLQDAEPPEDAGQAAHRRHRTGEVPAERSHPVADPVWRCASGWPD